MGWILVANGPDEVFSVEVAEPAGEPPKGRVTMLATERCSSGWVYAYRVRQIHATKAEAEQFIPAAKAERREWQRQLEERKAARAAARKAEGYAKRIHLHTQRHVWKDEKDFVAAREKGLALCELFKTGSKTLAADTSEVTCQNCLRLMRPN